jgi:WD40 repeat protein
MRPDIVVLGTEAGEVTIRHIADPTEISGSRDMGVPIMCVAVSQTAQTLAVACDDDTIRVLRGEDLSEMACLPSPGFVRDLDVSNDRLVAALSQDCRIRVWDLVSHMLVCESAPSAVASRLVIDHDEEYVLVGNAERNGYSNCFPLSAQTLAARARHVAGRGLTDEERRQYIGDTPV